MAKENLKDQEIERQERIDAEVSKAEQFIEKNKKVIWGTVAAVVLVFAAVLAYNFWVVKPKVAEAQEQMIAAENSFQAGNFDIALNGDGNVLGFKDVIESYGSKAGQAAYLYAGISALQLGQFEDAINYLKKYSGKEDILAARALACTGDAYVGLEDYKTAVSYFEKAAAKADNVFAASYLLKAGVTYEELGDKAAALKCYKTIEDKYPQSIEGMDIKKYITRIETAE